MRSTCPSMWPRRRASPWGAWSRSVDRSGRLARLELDGRKCVRLGQSGEQVAVRSVVVHQSVVFSRNPGVVGMASLPGSLVDDAAKSDLHQLLEAVEARLDGGVQERAVQCGPETCRGQHGVLLR